MAQTIQIKRSPNSGGTAAPSTLAAGELAYSDNSAKLFIGRPNDGAVLTIGGELYVNMLDHTAGTLTASSAIIVDSNKKINELLVDNITIAAGTNTDTIATTSGNLVLDPSGNLDIDAGTVDVSSQATELKIVDNSATALTISEGTNNYITLDSSNAAEKIKLNKQVEIGGAYTLPLSDGSAGQALITDGNDTVSFTTISTTLNISDGSNTDVVSLISDTLVFDAPTGSAISTAVSDNNVEIDVATATTSVKGVASFDSGDFTVSSGAVSIKSSGVSNGQLVNDSITIGSDSIALGGSRTDINGLTSLDVDNLTLDGNTVSASGALTLSPSGTNAVNVPSGYKDRSGFGTNSLVTKEYVDALKQSLDIKDSVRVATTTNLAATYDNGAGTLTNGGTNAALSIDGVSLAQGNRVLVKNQSSAAQNGIYVVTTVGDGSTAWLLTRADDANISTELSGGAFTFVEEGTVGGDNGFVFTHNGNPTLGTTALTVSQFSGAGQITAGTGLTKSGNTINAIGSATITANADSLQIKGVSSTANGDLIYGANGANGGYARLPIGTYDTTHSVGQILMVGASNTVQWTNTLDGGTF
jgi:hypothetical protein